MPEAECYGGVREQNKAIQLMTGRQKYRTGRVQTPIIPFSGIHSDLGPSTGPHLSNAPSGPTLGITIGIPGPLEDI